MARSVKSDGEVFPLSDRLVPDELWALVEPLLPLPKVRPQGGGRARVDDRAVFVAVTFVLSSGCAWRRLPPLLGVAVPTAYRRFMEWSAAQVWEKLRMELIRRQAGRELTEWSNTIVCTAEHRVAMSA